MEGGYREVNRRGVCTGWTVIGDYNIDGVALPGDPDRLAAVRGHSVVVSVGTRIDCSDHVVVRVNLATGTGDTVLVEVSESER